MSGKRTMLVWVSVFGMLLYSLSAQVPTGGPYAMKDSVIANGGGSSSGGSYDLSGSVGQNFAGANASSGGNYSHVAGFWQGNLAPTAAGVSISGRVLSPFGLPVKKARVSLLSAEGGVRIALSNPFGFYQFEDVEVGHTYLLEATSRQFQFLSQVVTIRDELTNLDFVGIPIEAPTDFPKD